MPPPVLRLVLHLAVPAAVQRSLVTMPSGGDPACRPTAHQGTLMVTHRRQDRESGPARPDPTPTGPPTSDNLPERPTLRRLVLEGMQDEQKTKRLIRIMMCAFAGLGALVLS